MATRTDLEDAWQNGYVDVLAVDNANGDLVTPFDTFLAAVADEFDPTRESERLVLNWVVVARARRKLLGPSPNSSRGAFQVAIISDIQSIMLEAVERAVNDGDLSSSQGDAVLAAYNAAW